MGETYYEAAVREIARLRAALATAERERDEARAHAQQMAQLAQRFIDASDGIAYNDAVTIRDHRGDLMEGYVAVREQQILDLDAACENLRPVVEATPAPQTPSEGGTDDR